MFAKSGDIAKEKIDNEIVNNNLTDVKLQWQIFHENYFYENKTTHWNLFFEV